MELATILIPALLAVCLWRQVLAVLGVSMVVVLVLGLRLPACLDHRLSDLRWPTVNDPHREFATALWLAERRVRARKTWERMGN